MEHKHINTLSPNVIAFYLRTDKFDSDAGEWSPRVPKVNGFQLEITATEPETEEIIYLPMRYNFSKQDIEQFICPHRTTIIDIELLRLPSPQVYRMVSL